MFSVDRADRQTHFDAVAGAARVTRKRNVHRFGNVARQQLRARAVAAGGEDNFSRRNFAILRRHAGHRAVRVLLERQNRRREAHLNIFLALDCLEEKIGDGFVCLPRVRSLRAMAEGKLADLELDARCVRQEIRHATRSFG